MSSGDPKITTQSTVVPLTLDGAGVAPLTVGPTTTDGTIIPWPLCLRCGTRYQGYHDCTAATWTPMPGVYGGYGTTAVKINPQFQAINTIACEPFQDEVVKVDSANGFAKAAQKVKLQSLKVVYGTEKYPAGTIIYVRGDCYTEPWAKQKYKLGDDQPEVILVPPERVMIAKYW
jgi:hypothetical protein